MKTKQQLSIAALMLATGSFTSQETGVSAVTTHLRNMNVEDCKEEARELKKEEMEAIKEEAKEAKEEEREEKKEALEEKKEAKEESDDNLSLEDISDSGDEEEMIAGCGSESFFNHPMATGYNAY